MAGLLPWLIMAPVNARLRPDLPWAAVGTAAFLFLYLLWLNGMGPPIRWSADRHRLLRFWPPQAVAKPVDEPMSVPAILAALAVLYLLWIVSARALPTPDLSPYPTTAYRFSVLIMGALVSGIVEEAAFRGYMQRGIERFGVHRAILITSLVFTSFHVVHGLGAMLLLAPGLFAASWLYGWLAVRTGTIVPGMVIHSAGDMAYTYFGLLGGDWRLLFA